MQPQLGVRAAASDLLWPCPGDCQNLQSTRHQSPMDAQQPASQKSYAMQPLDGLRFERHVILRRADDITSIALSMWPVIMCNGTAARVPDSSTLSFQ